MDKSFREIELVTCGCRCGGKTGSGGTDGVAESCVEIDDLCFSRTGDTRHHGVVSLLDDLGFEKERCVGVGGSHGEKILFFLRRVNYCFYRHGDEIFRVYFPVEVHMLQDDVLNPRKGVSGRFLRERIRGMDVRGAGVCFVRVDEDSLLFER